jgi:uncharacterized protein (TIRG00374 family)
MMEEKRKNPPNKTNQYLLTIFAFLLAAILLWVVLRSMDWRTFWSILSHGNYAILFLSIPISSANYYLRAFRWHILVKSDSKIKVPMVFWANMVGYLGNAYLPARAGEVIRSAYLGRKSGAGTSFVFATALVERLMDAIALVIIGSISVLLLSQISVLLAGAVKIMAIAGAVGLAIVIVVPFQEKRISGLIDRLPLPSDLRLKITQQITRFLVGMRSLHDVRRLSSFILLTAVIWLIDGLANMVGVRIISQTLTLGQSLILLAALGLSSAIPSTPGYIGVYQFVAVSVLVPFGFSRPAALAYILISQVANYLVISFWGLIGLWQVNRIQPGNGTETIPGS